MNAPQLVCQGESRRDLVRGSHFYGLDYVETSQDQLTLTVYFLGRAPQKITAANLQIQGGERITDVAVVSVILTPANDPALDDSMEVTVNHPGDFSTYCLSVRALDEPGRPANTPMAGFDPRYASVEFTFKGSCPSELDCAAPAICPPPRRDEPEINYLAKDYASFLQIIRDRLGVIMPGWQETHAPDIGTALVEVLAYVGDSLSYYQDAVATEAYLGTARQRISVRRHARLIDYAMHEGCNARAWVCLQVAAQKQLAAGADYSLAPQQAMFLSGLDQLPALAGKTSLNASDLNGVPAGVYDVFEPLVHDATVSIPLYAAHNEIKFYTWGDRQCCLPIGATKAFLRDAWQTPAATGTTETAPARTTATTVADAPVGTPEDVSLPPRQLNLAAGDVLIFEEVKGPVTGNAADADPSRRWAVRLTQVTPMVDDLLKTPEGRPTPLVAIEWAAADALPIAFCLSARLPAPDCRIIGDLSLAYGNVILVDHGRTISPCEDLGVVEKNSETGDCACEGSVMEMTSVPGVFRPVLQQSPLTYRCALASGQPAARLLLQNPRQASPVITLSAIPPSPDGATPLFQPADLQDDTTLAGTLQRRANPLSDFLFHRLSAKTKAALNEWNGANPPPANVAAGLAADLRDLLVTWLPQPDLLESGPADPQFVVEVDDNSVAHLRFGDGDCGGQPAAGTDFLACYRVGNGKAGNVGAERISKLAFRAGPPAAGRIISVRNPLAAQGGVDPEPVAEVKLFAPGTFNTTIERAVTAPDYATIAGRNPALQGANAELRWTGSWYEARVAVDPLGAESPDDTLLRNIEGYLNHFRRLGHDLAVNAAACVPLQLALDICVRPQYLRGQVEAALLDVFSNRVLPGGSLGFFNPDNLTFGQGIYLSRIVAAAQAVTGVQSVLVTKFQRLFAAPNHELTAGVLVLAPNEIAQLDNDPDYPEHGTLTLNLRGGR
jgi:hypothetical protein